MKLKPLYCDPNYKVSSDGYVISKVTGKPLKPSINHRGYEIVNISTDGVQRGISVHKAVAMAFVPGYREGLQVNHKDGNKRNNYYTNLEWTTPKENIQHAVNILKVGVGTNNGKSRGIVGKDKSGKVVYDYDCLSDCARDICGSLNYRYVLNSIYRALRGLRHTYKGCTWKYKDA